MSAKSFFKKSVPPRLFQRFVLSSHCTLEVWTTTCIVTNFGKDTNCQILVNPSNPQLSGVKNFPYFPRGGPVPPQKPNGMHRDWQPLGFVSQWGGMEVGTGMLYPVSVIDGLVHLHGGLQLRFECQWHRLQSPDPCPVGSAVTTGPGSLKYYQRIVHTTPPFYLHDTHPLDKLKQCYQAALNQAVSCWTRPCRVALPLLGSGARGFPHDIAMSVAAQACIEWCRLYEQSQPQNNDHNIALVFGLLQEEHAEQLTEFVSQEIIKQPAY